jgi:iron(III) transport system substrate-binding protein
MKRTRQYALAVGVLAATLAFTACSSSKSSSSTSSSGGAPSAASLIDYHGADRAQKLLSCAQSEGTLSVYNSNTAIDTLATAFGKAYPSIKVQKILAQTTDLLTRLKSETSAHKVGGDVLDLYESSIIEAQALGYTQPFYSPALATLSRPADSKPTGSDGEVEYFISHQSYSALGYNTQKIKTPPATLADFLNPQYKGDFSIDGHVGGIDWIGAVLDEMGQTKGTQFLQSMAKQGMIVQNVTAATMATFTGSGEVVMDPDAGQSNILALKAKGQPVAWAPVGPIVALPGTLALIKGAPHPCAGLLFIDYLLSPQGQKTITNAGFLSPVKGVAQASYLQGQDLNALAAKAFDPSQKYDATTYNTNYNSWSDILSKDYINK